MKYSLLCLTAFVFVLAALCGFLFLKGTAAIIFQILLAGVIMLTAGVLVRARRVKKPVPSSFAASFQSDLPQPAKALPGTK